MAPRTPTCTPRARPCGTCPDKDGRLVKDQAALSSSNSISGNTGEGVSFVRGCALCAQPADLLLHVVDISHANALNQFQAVEETLGEIGAGDIPSVTALNKVDRLGNPEGARNTARR